METPDRPKCILRYRGEDTKPGGFLETARG